MTPAEKQVLEEAIESRFDLDLDLMYCKKVPGTPHNEEENMVGVVLDEGIRGRQSNSHFPEETDDHFCKDSAYQSRRGDTETSSGTERRRQGRLLGPHVRLNDFSRLTVLSDCYSIFMYKNQNTNYFPFQIHFPHLRSFDFF